MCVKNVSQNLQKEPFERDYMKCENCNNEVNGNYCSNCGQPVRVRRIDSKYVIDEICNILFLEKGFLFTIKELFIRPGISITQFLNKNRNRLVKPIIFIILTSLVYLLTNKFFPFEDKYVSDGDMEDSYTVKLMNWVTNNYGYSNLLMGTCVAFIIKLFFRKYKYNYFEIFILLCFIMGFSMLILTLFGLAESLTGLSMMKYGAIVSIVYIAWAIGDFFGKNISNYFKSLIAYLIGMLLFITIIVVIGVSLDLIIKKQ